MNEAVTRRYLQTRMGNVVIEEREPDRSPGHRPNWVRSIATIADARVIGVTQQAGPVQFCCAIHFRPPETKP